MRVLNNNSVFYAPEVVPNRPEDLSMYLQKELDKIKVAIDLLALGHLDKTYVAPTKPRDGDIRYADGTSWDPGAGASGEGVFCYYAGVWNRLG